MYVVLVEGGRRLVTSDAGRLRLHDLGDPEADPEAAPKLIAEVEQPGQVPYFEQSPAGERLTAGGGLVARSFTPLGLEEHWTSAPSSVGLYTAADLSPVGVLELGRRLDHESLALSRDDRWLASVSRGEGAVVFDAKTGVQQWQLDGEIASGMSGSPDGRWLALGESGQADGELTLIETRPDDASGPYKHVLAAPKSGAGLYDSPFRSVFSSDGRFVVFTSNSWGRGGVAVYDVATRAELWSATFDTTDDEDAEPWLAPEVALALDDAIVLVGQDGRIQAFMAGDGRELSRLEYEPADARYFAADSARRRIWITRAGQPVFERFPSDWLPSNVKAK